MTGFFRRNLTTMLVAFGTAAITAGGPAIAATIADYARNADKVDGKHAVGAGASIAARKGKLVATSGTTGRLPNNIVAKPPDADRLDGFNSGAFWRKSESVHAATAVNSALLQGWAADDLIRVASGASGDSPTLTTSPQSYGSPMSIIAPGPGFVLVTSSMTVQEATNCTTQCWTMSQIRHIQTDALSNYSMQNAENYGTLANTTVFPVTAGENTFDIRVWRADGDGTIKGWWSNISAVYSPFNADGD